eukprot:scaffold57937_cov60-Phaeocystis_antarctica.AAC.7
MRANTENDCARLAVPLCPVSFVCRRPSRVGFALRGRGTGRGGKWDPEFIAGRRLITYKGLWRSLRPVVGGRERGIDCASLDMTRESNS